MLQQTHNVGHLEKAVDKLLKEKGQTMRALDHDILVAWWNQHNTNHDVIAELLHDYGYL